MIPFSVLDLAPINQGSDAAHAFRNSLDLAQHAERWNYRRFWLAEHHNMPGIASAATAVVIGYRTENGITGISSFRVISQTRDRRYAADSDEPAGQRYLGIFRSGRNLAAQKDLQSSRLDQAKVVTEDGGERRPVRQFFPPRPQDPGPRVQRPPRDLVDHAIGLGIV